MQRLGRSVIARRREIFTERRSTEVLEVFRSRESLMAWNYRTLDSGSPDSWIRLDNLVFMLLDAKAKIGWSGVPDVSSLSTLIGEGTRSVFS